jgi:N-acyl-D-amino-acid deacylase
VTFDILVRGAMLVDGSGAQARPADVGVKDGVIAAVGDLGEARSGQTIDAHGLVVSPGFVDAHVHTDAAVLTDPLQEASIRQGVTTHVVGQDGFGYAPCGGATLDFMRFYLAGINGGDVPLSEGGIGEYLNRVAAASAVNVATLVPNGCVRMEVLGNAAGTAGAEAVAAMAELCRAGMRDGAVGLSCGLDYVPSMHADEPELTALAAAVAELGGVYVTHIRYRSGMLEAVDEALRIGARAGVPVHISHLYGDQVDEILGHIDSARDAGVDAGFDCYPYHYGSSLLGYLLPEWLFEGSPAEILARLADPSSRARIREWLPTAHWDWSQWTIAGRMPAQYAEALGRDILQAAAGAGADPVHFACDLLLAAGLAVTVVGRPACAERSILPFLRHPAHVLGSDGIHVPGRIHPRGYGSFARYVGRMVRDGVLTLEEAVRHCTSAPAARFRLDRIGWIAPGHHADLVVFDAASLSDRSTLDDGRAPAEGVRDVLVSGVPVLLDGSHTGATPGRALRRASDSSVAV